MLAAGPEPAKAALVAPQARLVEAAFAPVAADLPAAEPAPFAMQDGAARQDAAAPQAPVGTVTDIMDFRSSGVVVATGDWIFAAPVVTALVQPSAAAKPAPAPAVTAEAADVPLPPANPHLAARETDETFSLKGPAEPLAVAPLPLKNPLGDRKEVAALPPSGPAPSDEPELSATVSLPSRGDRYAVYDIKGKTVYLPDGEKLEAHSGLGPMFDNPSHVSVRMRGPTPPNTYDLSPREALFHGVEALRMTPVGDGKMYGRDGILAHSYLLGPRGESNGCLSFKDYDKFLAAYKRGEISRVVVVAELPKNALPSRNLLSWLKI